MPSANGNGNGKPPATSGKNKNITILILIVIITYFIMQMIMASSSGRVVEMNYDEFLKKLGSGEVANVNVLRGGYRIVVTLTDTEKKSGKDSETKISKYSVNLPYEFNQELDKELRSRGVKITADSKEGSFWASILISFGPMLLLIGIWVFMMKRASGGMGGGNPLTGLIGKIGKVVNKDQKKVMFSDVGGIDEAREELKDIVEFLKNPGKFKKLGGKVPKGVLLVGPPGTGKTLLARAVAGEADAEFTSLSGSEFVEIFVGVGAARVRHLFLEAKKKIPHIIFMDEIDAIGKKRAGAKGFYGGNDEREQTLNQLLVEMDGFEAGAGIIIIAATNRADVLDQALLRPGRFDRKVVLYKPDVKGREDILKIHAKNLKLAEGTNLAQIAKGTPGFTGADLENLCNEAALMASKKDKSAIEMDDFENAKDKVIMGEEQRSRLISPEEKEVIAGHEAGHTIVALNTLGADPVHKVSIIPRGMSLGVTWQLPEKDKVNVSKQYLLGRIAILYGGRTAEEILFNEISTGAHDDIAKATEILERMICEWGMGGGEAVLNFNKELSMWTGQPSHTTSEATRREIDLEISRMANECRNQARLILVEHKNELMALKKALIEKESLDHEEILKAIESARK